MAGVNAGQFGLTDDTCSLSTVAAGASCSVEVRFTPTSTGGQTAVLSVASNALSGLVRGTNGKTSVRTFGYPNLKIRVTQKAPATQGYSAFTR